MTSGVYRYPGMDRVIYGRPLADVLGAEVDRLEARAVYVLASGSLARDTEVVTGIRRVLGNRCAGVTAKIGAHTPRTDVVEAANAAREAHADLILTVGGGSVTDAAKMVGLCLGNDVTQPSALDAYRATTASDGSTIRPAVKAPAVRFIAIPTTLSAGDFNASAGCTDTARHASRCSPSGSTASCSRSTTRMRRTRADARFSTVSRSPLPTWRNSPTATRTRCSSYGTWLDNHGVGGSIPPLELQH
jgi:alcohol dehydrogenase class IV